MDIIYNIIKNINNTHTYICYYNKSYNTIICHKTLTNIIVLNIKLSTIYLYNICNFDIDNDIIYILKYDICTLNIGYNIVSNNASGSEKKMVEFCQNTYNGGWNDTISKCTSNAIDFIKKYDIIGLQEVNPLYTLEIIKQLDTHEVYIMNELMIIVKQNMFGQGNIINEITKIGPKGLERGMMAVYFKNPALLLINLHAPHIHNIDKELIYRLEQLDNVLDNNIILKRIIIMGDFNDGQKLLLNTEINFRGIISKQKIKSKTCCFDVDYILNGDYIFDNALYSYELNTYEKLRYKIPLSDHDPAMLKDI